MIPCNGPSCGKKNIKGRCSTCTLGILDTTLGTLTLRRWFISRWSTHWTSYFHLFPIFSGWITRVKSQQLQMGHLPRLTCPRRRIVWNPSRTVLGQGLTLTCAWGMEILRIEACIWWLLSGWWFDKPWENHGKIHYQWIFKYLVGGLEHQFHFSMYWEQSSQLTNSFQRGWNHQPVNVEETWSLFETI